MAPASGADTQVGCLILDKGEVHLLILLQVQDQLSPLSHHPELRFEWMLKETTKECQFRKAGAEAPREEAEGPARALTWMEPQEVNEKGSTAFEAQT